MLFPAELASYYVFFFKNKPYIHTSHGTGVLFMQCCHGDVMHFSELLDGCLMVDCHLFNLAHIYACTLKTDPIS